MARKKRKNKLDAPPRVRGQIGGDPSRAGGLDGIHGDAISRAGGLKGIHGRAISKGGGLRGIHGRALSRAGGLGNNNPRNLGLELIDDDDD